MIACHRCANCSDCPDQDKRGICVFPQSLNPGEKVTAKVVKASIGTLISHGCKKCGSNPIHPGNNVGDGQVTINFVRDFCKTGVCDTAGAASPEDLAEPDKTAASTTTGIATLVGFTRTTSEEEEPPILPAFSPRDAAPDSAAALLGINCRGSVNCNSFCNRNIFQLRDYITQVCKPRLEELHPESPSLHTLQPTRANSPTARRLRALYARIILSKLSAPFQII
jgi:hypothetical protein